MKLFKFLIFPLTLSFSLSYAQDKDLICYTPSGSPYPSMTTPIRTQTAPSIEMEQTLLQPLALGTNPVWPRCKNYLNHNNQQLDNPMNLQYGEANPDGGSFFCDSFPIPSDIATTQPALLLVKTGDTCCNFNNDFAKVGKVLFNQGFMANAVTSAINAGSTTFPISIPSSIITQSINNPPANSPAPVLDIEIQDDTQILSTQLKYCQVKENRKELYSYNIKYLCGISSKKATREDTFGVVADGKYFTEINIANSHLVSAKLNKGVIPLLQFGEKIAREPDQIGIEGGELFKLEPLNSTLDDCSSIGRMLTNKNLVNQAISIGFLNILSPVPLDIESVTTTNALNEGYKSTPSIVIKHYTGRKVVREN